jgi:hypothetical protein
VNRLARSSGRFTIVPERKIQFGVKTMLLWIESQNTVVIALLGFGFCYALAAIILEKSMTLEVPPQYQKNRGGRPPGPRPIADRVVRLAASIVIPRGSHHCL